MTARGADELVDVVVAHYFDSGDFNGLHVGWAGFSDEERQMLHDLVLEARLEVVTEDDFINPYIRPWSTRRGLDEQAADVLPSDEPRGIVCLYPTATSLQGRDETVQWPDQPFRTQLAEGRGQLELAYFTVDVIEPYRNDPRFHYWFTDFEVSFGITDEAYFDPGEAERDKIGSIRVGFAYDVTTIRSNEVGRFMCSFLEDLAKLTPEHQQRWRTYEVDPDDSVHPHPVWWAMMGGNWPDGIGPFHRILEELEAINDVYERIYGDRLFRTSERPREWGWVVRPSTTEWHQFALMSDKLLSDNLSHTGLDAAGISRTDDKGDNAGTLTRLQWLLVGLGYPEEGVRNVLESMRRVRKLRQKPAHSLHVAATDAGLTAQQRDLLGDVGDSLEAVRTMLSSHPDAGDWEPPDLLTETKYRL